MNQPAYTGAAVTPSDSVDLSGGTCRALYVGGSGDISVLFQGSTTPVLFVGFAGGVLPIQVKRVRATGTTATSIVALY